MGLGDILDASSRTYELALQAHPIDVPRDDIVGFHGTVAQRTISQYQTLPSLGVCLLRIKKDLNCNPNRPAADWDLPVEICPNVVPAIQFRPTARLLGWSLAVPTPPDARAALGACGFLIGFPPSYDSICDM